MKTHTDTVRSFKRSTRIPRAALSGSGSESPSAEEGRSVEVAFSSETPVQDHPGGNPTILLHEPQAANFDRLRELGAVHFNHDVTRIVGKPLDVKIEKDRVARAVVAFDDDEEGEHALRKVRSGSLAGVSIGLRARESDVVSLSAGETWTSPGGKRFEGPVDIAIRWEPLEISLTSVPADVGVGVKRSTVMTTKTDDGQNAAVTTREDGMIERLRVRALTRLASKYDIADDTLDEWCDQDLSVEQAERSVVDHWMQNNPRIKPTGAQFDVGTTGSERFERAATAGILQRMGALRKDDEEYGKVEPELLPLVETARRMIGAPSTESPDRIATRALSAGTSSFPNLIESSLGRAIVVSFQEAPTIYRDWCAVNSTNRINESVSRPKLSDIPDLEETEELLPIRETFLTDAKETNRVVTYANRIGISRNAIINDDLSALSTVPALFGAAAARKVDQLAIDALEANPTLSDSIALFHGSHSNLGTGAAMSTTTLTEMIKLLRKQTAPNGSILSAPPSFLLAPADLEGTVGQQLALITPAKTTDAVPSVVQGLKPLISARFADTAAYYVGASPSTLPVCEVLFLNGNETPQLIRVDNTDVLGIEWIAFIDAGASIIDHRGMTKNAGS